MPTLPGLPGVSDTLASQTIWTSAKNSIFVPTHLVASSLTSTYAYGVPFYCERGKEMLIMVGFSNPASGTITAPLLTLQMADAFPVITSGSTPQWVTDPSTSAVAITVPGTVPITTTVIRVTANFGALCQIGFAATSSTLVNAIYATVNVKD